jgi:hypothetical protein
MDLNSKILEALRDRQVNKVILSKECDYSFNEYKLDNPEDILEVFTDMSVEQLKGKVVVFAPAQTATHILTLALPSYHYNIGETNVYLTNFKIEENK